MKMAQVAALLFLAGSITDLLAGTPKELAAEAAATGDLDAMFELGSIALSKGEYPEARAWLQKASDKKHAPSMAALGFLYFNGFGVAEDTARARGLYEQAAKAGAHQGLTNLAHLYRYGLAGLPKDAAKAIALLKQAAGKGNEYAVVTLSTMYRGDELGAPDMKKTLEWLEFGAKRNYPGCLSDLGFAYEHGIFVGKDLEQAIAYYRKAIALGSVSAESNLGYMYLMGTGVEKSYPEALVLFTSAAKKNDVGGLINLAVMKYRGLGCERDSKEAYLLLRKAGELGSPQAGQILKDWKAKEEALKK